LEPPMNPVEEKLLWLAQYIQQQSIGRRTSLAKLQ
jgi:hypothetical protein